MTQTKLLPIALLAVLIVGVMAFSGMFAITGGDRPTNVYTAQFDNAICTAIMPNEPLAGSPIDQSIQGTTLSNDIWFGAAFSSSTKRTEFICNANTKRCTATVDTKDHNGAFIGICPIDVDVRTKNEIKDKCRYYREMCDGTFFCGAERVSLPFNENQNFHSINEKFVVLSGMADPGDITIEITADIYGLLSQTSDNYLTAAIGTCNLKNMYESVVMTQKDYNQYVAENKIQDNIVPFHGIVNIFSSLVKVYDSTRIVQLGSGEWVYIKSIVNGVGQICPLWKTTDGKTITDCATDMRPEPSIICMPYTPDGEKQCSADGTEWVGELTCTWWGGGTPSGYITVGNELCLAKCVDGEIVYHSCVTILDCQTGYVFDPDKNMCVKAGGVDPAPPVNGTEDEFCKLDAECNDNLWWTYDTCDRTTWQEILNQEGLCKHTDLKALMIIGVGMFIAVLVAIIMSGRKK